MNDTINKVSSTSASSLMTDTAYILLNNEAENIYLTLASRLKINTLTNS